MIADIINYLIFSTFIIGLWEFGKWASKKIWRWNEDTDSL